MQHVRKQISSLAQRPASMFNCRKKYLHKGELKSLNDCLLSCPDLMTPLRSVIIRMRAAPILVGADIKAMFLKVKVPERDIPYLRLYWREGENSDKPVD